MIFKILLRRQKPHNSMTLAEPPIEEFRRRASVDVFPSAVEHVTVEFHLRREVRRIAHIGVGTFANPKRGLSKKLKTVRNLHNVPFRNDFLIGGEPVAPAMIL